MTDAHGPHSNEPTLAQLQRDHELIRTQLDTLLYCLSHDLRTPTMTALGFADLLINDLVDATPTTRQYLEHIRTAGTRQLSLIEELIRHIKWLSEPMQLEPLSLDIECQQAIGRLTDAQQAGITMHLPALILHGDRHMLATVLSVLLDNAVKFSRHANPPQIEIRAERIDGQIALTVTDNGVGFHPDHASRLFKPFRRLHPSREFAGIGMGLATAALLVQRQGGHMTAHGQVGGGAEFRVFLPIL